MKKMNIKDIAKIANVSISTVSRVINDKPGVKSEIRERVKKVIKENNFILLPVKRNLNLFIPFPKFTFEIHC